MIAKANRRIIRKDAPSKPLMSWFDRTLLSIAPGWAEKRIGARLRVKAAQLRYEALSSITSVATGRHFPGAKTDGFRADKWIDSGLSPDSALDDDLEKLQERAFELVSTNIVASSAVESRVTHEIGTGLTPQSQIPETDGISKLKAKAIATELEDIHRRWSETGVDEKRQFSMQSFQRQVKRCFATFGEAFVVIGSAKYRGPVDTALKLISPQRVSTPPWKSGDPNCRLGIQYSDDGMTISGYWIRTQHPGDNDLTNYEYNWKFEERFDKTTGQPRVLHIFEPAFPEQTRGFPWLAAAMNRIKDMDDFFEAELIAKQVEACFGAIITSAEGADPYERAEGNSSSTDSQNRRLEDITPGMVEYLSAGETLTTLNPQRPGANFAPFIELALRSIASSLNFPYELLAKNFFRTTYSSGRLAMLDGLAGFKMRASVVIDQFCKPVWQVMLYDAMLAGELDGIIEWSQYIRMPWKFERVKFVSKSFGFVVDPEKEAKANEVNLKNELKPIQEIVNESGGDFEADEALRLQAMMSAIDRHVLARKYQQEKEQSEGLDEAPYIFGEDTNNVQQPEKEPEMAGADK